MTYNIVFLYRYTDKYVQLFRYSSLQYCGYSILFTQFFKPLNIKSNQLYEFITQVYI